MTDTLEKPDVLSEWMLFEEACCDRNKCDEPAAYIFRHDECSSLCCVECREFIMRQLQEADDDELFWCGFCKKANMSPAHCWDTFRFISL